jgi:hypothetical protein
MSQPIATVRLGVARRVSRKTTGCIGAAPCYIESIQRPSARSPRTCSRGRLTRTLASTSSPRRSAVCWTWPVWWRAPSGAKEGACGSPRSSRARGTARCSGATATSARRATSSPCRTSSPRRSWLPSPRPCAAGISGRAAAGIILCAPPATFATPLPPTRVSRPPGPDSR